MSGMSGATNARRILIVGGVAGGASAAAKARRVGEQHEIHVFEEVLISRLRTVGYLITSRGIFRTAGSWW